MKESERERDEGTESVDLFSVSSHSSNSGLHFTLDDNFVVSNDRSDTCPVQNWTLSQRCQT